MKKVISNILGDFAFDTQNKSIEKLSSNPGESPDSVTVDSLEKGELKAFLECLKKNNNFSDFHENNIVQAKKDISSAYGEDILIIQCIRVIDDYDKIVNIMINRLRSWFQYFMPEVERYVENNEVLVGLLTGKSKEELLSMFNIDSNKSMGVDFSSGHYDAMVEYAKQIEGVLGYRQVQLDYLEVLMGSNCPNLLSVASSLLGARLIEHAGSIRRLSEMSASTIQLLGAEKALFRHIVTGAKCPKYGVLINHPKVNVQKQSRKGKAARIVADKVSIATKVDFFKGDFIGEKLSAQIDRKLKND